MVAEEPDSGSELDRGQLILIGSITIAIVVIGLAIVLNSVIFTENISGGSSVEVTDDVREFNREARRGTQSLVIRMNHQQRYSAESTLKDHLRQNFTNYSTVLAESYADTGSTYVNITYKDTEVMGARTVQHTDDEFVNSLGSGDWTPVDGGTAIGWFIVNLHTEKTSDTTPLKIKITDDSGTTLTISMKRYQVDGLRVNSSVSGKPSVTSNTTCGSQDNRVLIDLLKGSATPEACDFNSTEHLTKPYSEVEFVNGDEAYGKYEIVTNSSAIIDTDVNDCGAAVGDTNPCVEPAAWSVRVTTRYQTSAISYENTQLVKPYGPGTSNSDALQVTGDTTTDPPDNSTVTFVLKNTDDSDVTITQIAVNSTTSSDANWIRDGQEFEATNRSGKLNTLIEIGGPAYGLDTDASVPAGSATEFEFTKFSEQDTGVPNHVDMEGESITFTLYFADGSSKQFTITP